MAECIPQLWLDFHPTVPLMVTFDAPHISSDGGVLLLRQMDDRLGLSARLAALLRRTQAIRVRSNMIGASKCGSGSTRLPWGNSGLQRCRPVAAGPSPQECVWSLPPS